MIYRSLAQVIEEAGGLAEAVSEVSSSEEGLELLRKGYVIKRDCSDEIRHVFFPKMEPFVDYGPEAEFEVDDKTRTGFENAWKENQGKKKLRHWFIAQRYNSCLKALGEVRVYFVFGKYVDMIHTLPEDRVVGRIGFRSEECYGRLSDVTKMVRPATG